MAKTTSSETAASTQPEVETQAARIAAAIAEGKELIVGGSTKADAAWRMFQILRQDARETVVVAFIEGAGLTPKGAMTYWYNCRRKAGRLQLVGEGKKAKN